MRVYIAAPWVHRFQANEAAIKVKAAGHVITHDWWNHDTNVGWTDHADLAKQALADIEGVKTAHAMIVLNTAKSEGKATEQGMALAYGVPIIGVGTLGEGETRNVFHYLSTYTWVKTIEDAIKALESAVEVLD